MLKWKQGIKISTKLKKRILLICMYSFVAAGSMWVEHGNELFGSDTCGIGLTVRFWHHWLSTAGYRQPRAHFVRIVSLTPDQLNVGDICAMRKFVGSLLLKLQEADPAVIVVDMWYPSGLCEMEGSSVNQDLIKAFQRVSSNVPVVVARTADTAKTLRDNQKYDLLKSLQANGFTDEEIVLGDDLLHSVTQLERGIAFPGCDNRRIPVDWPLYVPTTQPQVKHGSPRYDTLALATAKIYDPEVENRLKSFANEGVDPFTSFIAEEGFRPTKALTLCNPEEAWETCHLLDRWKHEFRGRVLLLGEFSSRDLHDSVLGTVPGAVLQANYIESLLDDRYFRPLRTPVEFALTVLCLAVIEAIFYHAERRPLLGLLAVSFLLILIATSYFAIMQFGLFLVFWIPSLFAIIFRSAELLRVLLKAGARNAI